MIFPDLRIFKRTSWVSGSVLAGDRLISGEGPGPEAKAASVVARVRNPNVSPYSPASLRVGTSEEVFALEVEVATAIEVEARHFSIAWGSLVTGEVAEYTLAYLYMLAIFKLLHSLHIWYHGNDLAYPCRIGRQRGVAPCPCHGCRDTARHPLGRR